VVGRQFLNRAQWLAALVPLRRRVGKLASLSFEDWCIFSEGTPRSRWYPSRFWFSDFDGDVVGHPRAPCAATLVTARVHRADGVAGWRARSAAGPIVSHDISSGGATVVAARNYDRTADWSAA
jgi:hypothetical protein